jgi:hypothetical protein
MCQVNANSTTQDGSTASTGDPPGTDILQRLVSEAVKKVLQHPEMLVGSVSSVAESSIPQALVSQVVEELKPSVSQIGTTVPVPEAPVPRTHKAYLPPAGIPSYKPTPISELQKRHIPVPYTPSPAPRGSSKVQVKRPSLSDDNSGQKRVKPDAKDNKKADQEYSPKLDMTVKNVTYDPSSLKYSPPHNGWSSSNKLPSYVPSSIDTLSKSGSSSSSSSSCNDYVPSPVSTSVPVPQYCPTEKSDSSSEPNYVPLGSGNNRPQMSYTPTTKTELQDDIVDIDLSTEFDLLDEILNENSNDSQQGSAQKTEEDGTVVHNILDNDKPKLSDENMKLKVETSETLEPDDVNHRSRQKKTEETHVHVESHTEPQLLSSPSNKKDDDLEKIKKSKSKRHTEEKTKEQGRKKHNHVKHSSSSRSGHRKSGGKSDKGETGVRNEKKDIRDDSKSNKHHKVKEESKTKERHGHHSDKKSEKHTSAKTRVKGEIHSRTSKSKHKSQDDHHRHHNRKKHTSGKHHENSKSYNREGTGIKVMTTGKMTKAPSPDDCGKSAGKLFHLH